MREAAPLPSAPAPPGPPSAGVMPGPRRAPRRGRASARRPRGRVKGYGARRGLRAPSSDSSLPPPPFPRPGAAEHRPSVSRELELKTTLRELIIYAFFLTDLCIRKSSDD